MAFNPLEERGIPLEKQVRSWRELAALPYDKHEVDPYTRCRIITMNGIEVEAALFSHQFARHTADLDLKRQLAEVRQIEQVHGGDKPPSERVIDDHRRRRREFGQEYRLETEGTHPAERLRTKPAA